METDVKKWLIRLSCELRYGCAYVYARLPGCEWCYRRYFNIYGSKSMWRCVRDFKDKGFRVNVWRPCPSL
jgi:hypothetical protein